MTRSRDHEWCVVENFGNCRYNSISELYAECLDRARNDLVLFVHQDVFLPHDWEERFFASLAELQKRDPDWGYSWIPVAGPILGGLLAAWLYSLPEIVSSWRTLLEV